jgi:hypothetical protein
VNDGQREMMKCSYGESEIEARMMEEVEKRGWLTGAAAQGKEGKIRNHWR